MKIRLSSIVYPIRYTSISIFLKCISKKLIFAFLFKGCPPILKKLNNDYSDNDNDKFANIKENQRKLIKQLFFKFLKR